MRHKITLIAALAFALSLSIGLPAQSGGAALRTGLPEDPPALPRFGEGGQLSRTWTVDLLPNQTLPQTRFTIRNIEGREALVIRAVSSFGNLTHRLEPPVRAGRLTWAWRVERFSAGADLRHKHGDDNAIKVCAFFDLAIQQVPFWDRFLLKQARKRAGRDLPTATVCYAWDPKIPKGTRLNNPFSKRLRYIVLRSGPAESDGFQTESRDLGLDFLGLFTDESRGAVPPLLGVSVGADSDNTQGDSLAWIADLHLVDAPR